MAEIRGILCTVTGAELSKHCENRRQYHQGRADVYQAQVGEIEKLRKSSDEAAKQVSKGSSQDPLDALENSMKTHISKARFFAFCAAHFPPENLHLISYDEMTAYELAPGRY